jgi:nucleotide sugar dehydrogenase
MKVPDDLMVAYSPERIDPANPVWHLRNTPKVVAGVDDASRDAAAALYGKFCDQVVLASSMRAAEMSKLLENTYRHVNIALVNELALVADDLGVDIFEVIELASTKPFGYQAFYPGPGVGGHCIPIDPHYLSYRLRSLGRGFRFVELAREINDSMPSFVSLRVVETLNDQQKAVSGARIVLAGVSYKANVGDVREAPSIPIVRRLRSLGADLVYVDPHVSQFDVDGEPVRRATDLVSEARTADLLIVLTPHVTLPIDEASSLASLTLDTRGVLPPSETVRRM